MRWDATQEPSWSAPEAEQASPEDDEAIGADPEATMQRLMEASGEDVETRAYSLLKRFLEVGKEVHAAVIYSYAI